MRCLPSRREENDAVVAAAAAAAAALPDLDAALSVVFSFGFCLFYAFGLFRGWVDFGVVAIQLSLLLEVVLVLFS